MFVTLTLSVTLSLPFDAAAASVFDCVFVGVLSMGYDGLWPNSTRENIYAHMTPTTPSAS